MSALGFDRSVLISASLRTPQKLFTQGYLVEVVEVYG